MESIDNERNTTDNSRQGGRVDFFDIDRDRDYDDDTARGVEELFRNRPVQEDVTRPSQEESYQRVAKNSCGRYETPCSKKKRKKENPARKSRRVLAGVGAAILLTSSLYGLHTAGVKVSDWIRYQKDTKTAVAIAEENAVNSLLSTGLAAYTKDDEFVILQNDSTDYQELNLSTTEEIWAMRRVINDDEEFEKVIQSCVYYDENGNCCNYTDTEQFLGINGYFDTKTSQTSTEVWENYAESNLVDAYRNGTLTLEGTTGKGR